ncbi:MAG: alpha/beta-hydrolase family protein [Candidatus Nanopelagicales bacterium]
MTTTATEDRDPRPGRPARRRWWALDPGGSLVGLALAVLSVTPSLLPRPGVFQGAIAAAAFAVGYLAGAAGWAALRRILRGRLSSWRPPRWWWPVYGALWVAALAGLSWLALLWQNEVRRIVEMPPLPGVALGAFLLGFLPVAALLLAAGKGVRGLFLRLRGRMSAALAALVSAAVVASGVAVLTLGALAAVDAIYRDRNALPDADLLEPSSEFRSAGPGSAIAWESLGWHGGAFVGGGPSAAEIAALAGGEALEPNRVYAGLASAPTVQERADLVVAELERTGAFDRAVLVVATTTGSGWLEPQAVDAIEYLYRGDTAIAAMQYAYTPSWVSFVFDPDAPVEAARALFEAVEARWLQLPEDERPLLVVYGLSLGAHGGQAVFADLADLRGRVDGALFTGSPNGSELWRGLQARRDAGSPAWQPVLDEGREVRWISRPGDEALLTGPWDAPRVLYLQHATDPVTWLGPELLWRSPEWLEPGQRGPDISPSMRWIPVVTALQVAVDMLGGEAVPARHGHNFGDVAVTGWREVVGDAGLDAAALARVQAEIESYAPIPPWGEPY